MNALKLFAALSVTILVAALWGCDKPAANLESHSETATNVERHTQNHTEQQSVGIPTSVQKEHEAIHAALVEATRAPGRTGQAAGELAEILDPHFAREEQIALPPLGLLAQLSANKEVADPILKDVLAMTDALRSELPAMMEQHKKIEAAVAKLRAAAVEEKQEKAVEFADELALHAKTEEEVLYPAAILVGDVIRARTQKK